MRRALIFVAGFVAGWYASLKFTERMDPLGFIDESSGIG